MSLKEQRDLFDMHRIKYKIYIKYKTAIHGFKLNSHLLLPFSFLLKFLQVFQEKSHLFSWRKATSEWEISVRTVISAAKKPFDEQHNKCASYLGVQSE